MPMVTRILLGLTLLPVALAAADEAPKVDYSRQIKPLLAKHCQQCHGPQKQQSGLRIDSGRGLLDGGDSGPAVIPKDIAKSLLIHAVTGTEGASKMPPEGPGLSAAEIQLLKDWIASGASFPQDEVAVAAVAKRVDHWAFQPVLHPNPPIAKSYDGLRGPLDSFVVAKQSQVALAMSPEADRTTLIRRVSLDLRGVPPTPRKARTGELTPPGMMAWARAKADSERVVFMEEQITL